MIFKDCPSCKGVATVRFGAYPTCAYCDKHWVGSRAFENDVEEVRYAKAKAKTMADRAERAEREEAAEKRKLLEAKASISRPKPKAFPPVSTPAPATIASHLPLGAFTSKSVSWDDLLDEAAAVTSNNDYVATGELQKDIELLQNMARKELINMVTTKLLPIVGTEGQMDRDALRDALKWVVEYTQEINKLVN